MPRTRQHANNRARTGLVLVMVSPLASQRGNVLVIALAIAAASMLAVLAMSGVASRAAENFKRTRRSNDADMITTQVRQALASEAVCRQTFLTDPNTGESAVRPRPTAGSSQSVNQVRAPGAGAGRILYTLGAPISGHDDLQILSMSLKSEGSDSEAMIANGVMLGRLSLVLGETAGANPERWERSLPLTLTYAADGSLTKCVSNGGVSATEVRTVLTSLGTCPGTDEFVTGITSDGTLTCGTIPITTREVMVGGP